MRRSHTIAIILLSFAIPMALFCYSLTRSGERVVEPLETMHGIPYSLSNGKTTIEENLAHADINLIEPVLAKTLHLTIAFDPGNTSHIDVGIRENDFWLSYKKYPLFDTLKDPKGSQIKEISIPLSDAFQETDRSIDMMLFSETQSTTAHVLWNIGAIRATVESNIPTTEEMFSYIKSIIKKERAL